MYKTPKKRPTSMPNSERPSVTPEIIKILPNLLWFALAVSVFVVGYKPVLLQLSSGNISKMSFAAFQIEFARSEFDKASVAWAAERNISPKSFQAFDAERIQREAGKLAGARALWVTDENPTGDFPERRALSSIGISFDLARSTDEAQQLFDLADQWQSPYHLIISDIHRDKATDPVVARCFPTWSNGPAEAGCKLLQVVIGRYPTDTPSVIFYSRDALLGTPPGASGATDRFDELVRLVLDAVERRPPPTPRPEPKTST